MAKKHGQQASQASHAPKTPSFDDFIQADREKRQNELLANQLLGKNRINKGRRASAPGSGSGVGKAKPGSLASRIGPPQLKRSASTSLQKNQPHPQPKNKPQTRQAPATVASARLREKPARKQNPKNKKEHPHKERYASLVENVASTGFSIKGASGPFVVVGSNFAPGTTAADIQAALGQITGPILSCRVIGHHPAVTAEIAYAEKGAAENAVANFHNQWADGRLLEFRLNQVGDATHINTQNTFNNLREQNELERRNRRDAQFQDGRYGFGENGQPLQNPQLTSQLYSDEMMVDPPARGTQNRRRRNIDSNPFPREINSPRNIPYCTIEWPNIFGKIVAIPADRDKITWDGAADANCNLPDLNPQGLADLNSRKAPTKLHRARENESRGEAHRVASSTANTQHTTHNLTAMELDIDIRNKTMVTGPIPIAAFMRQVLTSPEGGYYTTKEGGNVFGKHGDFVTSPEISQVFGELIGIWTIAEWMAQGRTRSGVQLMEVGPGKGTLMDDMLRTFRNFKSFSSSVEAIYLVEASPTLRQIQKHTLCGEEAAMEETDIGHRSICKYFDVPVIWVEDIRLLPHEEGKTPFIFAHEFFDALPIHAFESVPPSPENEPQTKEIMTPTGPQKLHEPLKVANTPQWRELLVTLNPKAVEENIEGEPEFKLTKAKASTPNSLVIPEASERYRALKSQPGSTIEVSPESRIYAADFARRIGGDGAPPRSAKAPAPESVKKTPSGAALIMDYGTMSTIPINSLRGIQNHKNVPPLSSPGQVDVSADVDFTSLAEAALEGSEGVEVHGPVEQGDFLTALGIEERMQQLLRKVKDEGHRKTLETGWKRLIEKSGGSMGQIYKVMTIIPENDGQRRPVGFGGGIGMP
ncbi:hypothetical protein N7532_000429 [Penicillium argentinense]|uniref:type II protein arginine methyltransferase n=1 Tax=Penicillium argentinense TaxID=1131581 RepID=A0A9W9G5I0_9EURO|nr:uncharacterized protein N7532_000429 [Penicillium argentinense]KAJ5112384.1 hypothetical protein N7532_000429 [Penicillium argentinense]